MTYYAPEFLAGAFTCPHCNAYAKMNWENLMEASPDHPGRQRNSEISKTTCSHCEKLTYWIGSRGFGLNFAMYAASGAPSPVLIHPLVASAPMPHVDMPQAVQADYLEARSIAGRSPRGAAALLRLCVQKLCKELGESGKNINADIASLVQKGLPVQIQQALDVVRVVGNDSVHPGQLSEQDIAGVSGRLFELLNFIVEDRITRPKALAAMYASLPQDKLKGIEDRDNKGGPAAAAP